MISIWCRITEVISTYHIVGDAAKIITVIAKGKQKDLMQHVKITGRLISLLAAKSLLIFVQNIIDTIQHVQYTANNISMDASDLNDHVSMAFIIKHLVVQ